MDWGEGREEGIWHRKFINSCKNQKCLTRCLQHKYFHGRNSKLVPFVIVGRFLLAWTNTLAYYAKELVAIVISLRIQAPRVDVINQFINVCKMGRFTVLHEKSELLQNGLAYGKSE